MPAALTLIGLHYWAGSGRAFAAVAKLLAPDYRLLAPDLKGFGAAPAGPDFSLDAYADQVAGLVEAQGLRHYVLVGHSMGGKIALALAARQPPGLAGVVLLSPSPPGPEPMAEADRQAALRAHGQPTAAEETFRKITAQPLSEALHQQIVADNLRSSFGAWAAWLQHGSREDLRARLRLAGVQVPCLLLAGAADAVLPPAVHRAHTLPLLPAGTELHLIPGAGHLLPYEAPEAVATRLRAFCRQL